MRLIFAGTPNFSVPSLQALIHSKHEIIAVYTQPDRPAGRGQKIVASPVKTVALSHHLPIYQPATLKAPDAYQQLLALNADAMIVVAYGLIIPTPIIDVFKERCLNLHPSLLPRWRGASPIQTALLSGDDTTGVSIMQITEGLDSGPVFATREYKINASDTAGTLHDQLAEIGASLLLDVLNNIASYHPVPQDEMLATYSEKITKSHAKIDWNKSANELAREVRAFNPIPIAYCQFRGAPLRIWKAEASTASTTAKPGTIVNTEQAIGVATGQGLLTILTCQLPGGKPISAKDFINAHPDLLYQHLE